MNTSTQALKQAKLEAPVHPKGLTPHIVLVASLLYMMSTDGDLAPEEISRLQESVGLDKEAIPKARNYIKKNKFDTFLSDSCDVLDKPSQVCILANVYECMLSDGVVQKAETKLFQKIQKAYGFNDKTFLKIASVLDTKSNNALLGNYDPVAAQKHQLTPHMILAASILYMMSADGEVSEEEIGQLSAVINPYEGLQAVAMAYVDQYTLVEFIAGAQNKLNAEQKLYVLLNLCDSMLADGVADQREVAIFNQFLEVFGFTEHAFKPYYSVIHIKNVKPFESHDSSVEDANGLFKNIINNEHGGFSVQSSDHETQKDKQLHDRIINDDEDGEKIRRTMEENTKNITDGFGGTENITKVANNALAKSEQTLIHQDKSEINLQKANAGTDKENVQKVSTDKSNLNLQNIANDSSTENTQKINASDNKDNVQTLSSTKASDNVQTLASTKAGDNLQTLASTKASDNLAKLESSSASTNIQNLNQGATEENKQTIDKEGNQSNVQTLPSNQASENLAKLDASNTSANVQSLNSKTDNTNNQSIDSPIGSENRQGLQSEALSENIQSIANSDNDLNKQKLAKDQTSSNQAKLSTSSTEVNVQAIANKSNSGNTLTLSPNASSLNKVALKGDSNSENKAKALQERIEDKNKAEENHILSGLIKATENSSPLERLKSLSDQLKSVNAKLNQVENNDRDLPIPMDDIDSRLDKKLKQETNLNTVKVKSSNAEPNQASIPIDTFKDNFATDSGSNVAIEISAELPSVNDDDLVSFDDDHLKDEFVGESSGDLKTEFREDQKNDLKDDFKVDFQHEFQDDFKEEFNDDIEDDFKDDFNITIENSLRPRVTTNLGALANMHQSTSLFDELLQNAPQDSNGALRVKSPAIQSLSLLDGSLLALQIKNAKGTSITQISSSKKSKSAQLIYKAIKSTLVFAFIFSWHFYSETSCDMVSCSWSQIGSPVRLDLKPEVVPASVLSILKVAAKAIPSRQV